MHLWEAATKPRVGGMRRGAKPVEEVETMHIYSVAPGTTDFKALSYPHVDFNFPCGGRCFKQRDSKRGRPRKTTFYFTNAFRGGKFHLMELAKEDLKRRETRQS